MKSIWENDLSESGERIGRARRLLKLQEARESTGCSSDGVELLLTLDHQDSCLWCSFSCDSRLVLSLCEDGTLCVWDSHSGSAEFRLQSSSVISNICLAPASDVLTLIFDCRWIVSFQMDERSNVHGTSQLGVSDTAANAKVQVDALPQDDISTPLHADFRLVTLSCFL